MLGPAEEIDARVERNVGGGVAREQFERVDDLIDVFGDQPLGAEHRLAVKRAAADAIDVAVNTLVQRIEQFRVIAGCPKLSQPLEAPPDGHIVEVLRLIRIHPLLYARRFVVRDCRLPPLVVAVGGVHGALQAPCRRENHSPNLV